MSEGEAAVMADEQIALWRRQGINPQDAWRGMCLPWSWAVEWWEVRRYLIRWVMANERRQEETARLAA